MMGNKDWNFITVGQTGFPSNASDRTRIRKAAMQSFRQKERIERVKAFAAAQAQEEEPICQSVIVPWKGNDSELSLNVSENAVEGMVKLMDRRQSITSKSTLDMALSWCDMALANLHSSKSGLTSPTSPFAEVGPNIIHDISVTTLKEDVFRLMEDLRYLAALKTALTNSQTATLAKASIFDTQIHALEERILSLRYTFCTMPSLGFTDQFLNICCIAASIIASVYFRNFNPELPALRTLKQDLTSAIENIEALYGELKAIPDSETPYAEVLLWAFCAGGSLALKPSETTWFANRIIEVLPWTPVTNWLDAEASLKRTFWVDKMNNAACVALWADVQGRFSLGT